jgi:alpha,alpha-trehalase
MSLAKTIKERWCNTIEREFIISGKLMEKYNVVDTSNKNGGGEYPTQDGFGWTNGVYLAMKNNLT